MKTKIITYTNGQKALVLEHVQDRYGRNFSTYYVLNSVASAFNTQMFSRLSSNSRYIAQIDTVEASAVMADFIGAYAGLKLQQARVKLYSAHTITCSNDTYTHDGSSDRVYQQHLIEEDEQCQLAFEMAKGHLADIRRLVDSVRVELEVNGSIGLVA